MNVTEGNRCTIRRILDTTLKTDGIIANIKDVVVYISGINTSINASAEDEGVWLEDMEGTIVAQATISGSTSTTIDCAFPTLPLVLTGEYKLVVATRGGLGSEFGVSIARKSVEIRAVE